MPGFVLSGLYILYIIIVALIKPSMAPKLARDYGPQTRTEFWMAIWRGLFPMTALMFIVIGSIFAGWATPTESAALGVVMSFLLCGAYGKLSIKMLHECFISTVSVTATTLAQPAQSKSATSCFQ